LLIDLRGVLEFIQTIKKHKMFYGRSFIVILLLCTIYTRISLVAFGYETTDSIIIMFVQN